MKLELEICDSLCVTELFVINGISADSDDFGTQGDNDADNAEDYGCGDMIFERKTDTNEILKKYNITKEEYEKTAEKLEKGLSFGCCGWCV